MTQLEFKKSFRPHYTNEIFTIAEVLNTKPPTYRIKDYSGEEVSGTFYEMELVRYNKQDEEYEIEKIIQRKGGKALVKWKGYPNTLNSWINSDDIKTLRLKY